MLKVEPTGFAVGLLDEEVRKTSIRENGSGAFGLRN